jgi:uncharacterized protein YjbI with pentapeptide repeats
MAIRDHQGQPTGRTWPSNFKGADLTDTKLTRVDLQSAKLDGANLEDVVIVEAVPPERR